MDQRHVIAYLVLLLIVAGLGAAWWGASAHWRARRRASRAFERRRIERRAEEVGRGG